MKWISTHGERREHIFIIGITWCVSEECVPLPGQTSKLFGFLQCKFAKQLFHRNLWLHIFSTFQVLITWLCILKMCMFTHEQSKVIPNDCSLSNTYKSILVFGTWNLDAICLTKSTNSCICPCACSWLKLVIFFLARARADQFFFFHFLYKSPSNTEFFPTIRATRSPFPSKFSRHQFTTQLILYSLPT